MKHTVRLVEDDDPEDTSLEPVVVQYTIEDDDPRN